MTVVTDPRLVITPNSIPRPNYLLPVLEAGFGSQLTRIMGSAGLSIPSVGGTWALDARHHYSRDNPWSCDGTLVKMEQRGGSPSDLLLDGLTWAPVKSSGLFAAAYETRWHPTRRAVMVGWFKGAGELRIFDALTDLVYQTIQVGNTNLGLLGEGSLSDDGSMVALGDTSNNALLVDIVNGRVGPLVKVDFGRPDASGVDNLSVSPLSTPAGGRVVFKAGNTPEYARVYIYGSDLVLTQGPLLPVTQSHADVGVTPYGTEVFCGGWRSNVAGLLTQAAPYDQKNGRIVAAPLDGGTPFGVSLGTNLLGAVGKEAADQHCSCRGPRGWVLTTYAGPQETSGQFVMELVAWKLDGSRECVRFGVTRTNETNCYRCEAHGVMRPDGRAVMFASNYQWATTPLGRPDDIKACVYVVDQPLEPPPVTLPRYYVDPAWQYEPQGAVFDHVTGRIVPLPEVVRLLNLTP